MAHEPTNRMGAASGADAGSSRDLGHARASAPDSAGNVVSAAVATRSEERSASRAQRKLDGDILVNASYNGESHLYAAQTLEGARDLVRVLRAAGWEARIRVWAHDAVRVTSDRSIGGYREVA